MNQKHKKEEKEEQENVELMKELYILEELERKRLAKKYGQQPSKNKFHQIEDYILFFFQKTII